MGALTTGQLIKKYRLELGLTQEELAKTFDPPISRNTINRWENGHVGKMYASHFAHLCHIFNCEPSDLLGLDMEAEEIAERYKQATPEIRDIVKKLLRLKE